MTCSDRYLLASSSESPGVKVFSLKEIGDTAPSMTLTDLIIDDLDMLESSVLVSHGKSISLHTISGTDSISHTFDERVKFGKFVSDNQILVITTSTTRQCTATFLTNELEIIRSFKISAKPISAIRVLPSHIALGISDGSVKVIDMKNAVLFNKVQHGFTVTSVDLVITGDNAILCSGSADYSVSCQSISLNPSRTWIIVMTILLLILLFFLFISATEYQSKDEL